MKIFILEDDENRIRFFKRKFVNNILQIARNASEAYDILSYKDIVWDIMFLDHDLGSMKDKDYAINNGYEVAKFIVDNDVQYKHAIVHSVNYEGASRMAGILHDAQYIPFFNLKNHLEEYLRADENV